MKGDKVGFEANLVDVRVQFVSEVNWSVSSEATEELEQENAKLKRLVAELSLAKLMLKGIASGDS